MGEVKKTHQGPDFYLTIINKLKQGLYPAKICKELNISKQSLNYYISTLKQQGIIIKKGYGLWEVDAQKEVKEVKKTHRVGITSKNSFNQFKPDKIRGHGFMFKLKIPKGLNNWNKREEILIKKGIKFTPIKRLGSIQSILFKERKIWLTNHSIIIYEPSSYLADTAEESKSHAVSDLIGLITSLEHLLGASFRIKGQYLFKVSRHHYSMIKNSLARQYDREGKKLNVYNESGLWFLIDNSFNLHEAETVNPKTSDADMDKHVLPFFNGLKEVEGFTPQFVLESLGRLTSNFEYHSENMRSHVKAVQDLGSGVTKFNEKLGELTKVVKELKEQK